MKSFPLALFILAALGSDALAQATGSAVPVESVMTPFVSEEQSVAPRFWVNSEYLLWWFRNGPAPIPVATSAPPTSRALIPGALGNADTTILLGGNAIDPGVHHGGRFTIGSWLGDSQSIGVEANYFFLADRSTSQSISGNASATAPILGNPFFDPSIGREALNFLTAGTAGSTTLSSHGRMQGAELNVFSDLLTTPNARVSLVTGVRYLQLQEGISVATTQTDPNVLFFPGQFVNTADQFSTRNNFYAGQLGARLDYTRGRFFVQGTAKIALGNMHEIVDIDGYSTTNTGPNFRSKVPVTTVRQGIYAQPTNIGEQSRDRFAVAPELTMQVGVNVTRRVRAFVGHDFLYISDVARPGNQMDPSVNGTQLVSFTGVPPSTVVGAPRPTAGFNDSDFWAQGINFGISFQW